MTGGPRAPVREGALGRTGLGDGNRAGDVDFGPRGKKREIEKMEMANWAESKGIGLGQKKGRRERFLFF